jgi:hypothetical protein
VANNWFDLMQHVFFSHIPKTGGVSIRSAIAGQVPAELMNPAHVASFIQDTDWPKIQQYRFSFAHVPLYLKAILPSPLFTFTFLRDPIDRVISSYNHMLRHEGEEHRLILENKLDILDCLDHPYLRNPLINMMTRYLGCSIDLRKAEGNVEHMLAAHACAIGEPPDEFTFQRAVKRLKEIDFVGLTETLDDDLPRLMTILGLPNTNVPRENRDSNEVTTAMPRAVLTPELAAIIAKYNAYDVELYQRAREGLAPSANPNQNIA